jgi:hypothetical protein
MEIEEIVGTLPAPANENGAIDKSSTMPAAVTRCRNFSARLS